MRRCQLWFGCFAQSAAVGFSLMGKISKSADGRLTQGQTLWRLTLSVWIQGASFKNNWTPKMNLHPWKLRCPEEDYFPPLLKWFPFLGGHGTRIPGSFISGWATCFVVRFRAKLHLEVAKSFGVFWAHKKMSQVLQNKQRLQGITDSLSTK